MNRKLAVPVVVLLLAGATAVAVMMKRDAKASGSGAPDATPPRPAEGTPATTALEEAAARSKVSDRSARELRDAELVERYGSARTALSRQVSENVVSLLDDAIEVGQMVADGGGFGGGRMALQGALRGTGIELTEEQQGRAAELYREFQQRELEKSRSAVDALRKDPAALMELFLAGDARKRGELGEEAYAQVQAAAGERLMDVVNPLDRNNFRGGRPLEDETFRAGLEALLDEQQAELLDTQLAQREAEREARPQDRPGGVPEGNISNIPAMELDTLYDAVSSAKQMTSGFKQVLEGMGNLRQLQPQIEGDAGDAPQ